MRSNDTILLEKAYESILGEKFMNESDESGFKLHMNSRMSDALGEEIYSLPKNNFYDAIERGNLNEMSWYLRSRGDGHDVHLLKIVDLEDNKIYIEDEQREYTQKYISSSQDENDRIKYKIYDYNPKIKYLSQIDIYPDSIIIGPIENEETIYNIERYMDSLISRSKSMERYFKDKPNAPLD